MLSDVRYAMRQVRLVMDGQLSSEWAKRDAMRRAMDALERLEEAAQDAEREAEELAACVECTELSNPWVPCQCGFCVPSRELSALLAE